MSIKSAISELFKDNRKKKSLKSESSRKFARNVTLLFVDLASVDNDFGYDEQECIQEILLKMFKASKDDIYTLIKEAEVILKSNSNIDDYARELQDISTASEREEIMRYIDKLIKADGEFDQYEIKLRHRYEKLLGVSVRPQ